MKNKPFNPLRISALALLLMSINSNPLSLFAQGSAFTYQGRLNDGGTPANGVYDLRFAIYDASANGSQAGNSVTNLATGVSNGLFAVTLNFGGIFTHKITLTSPHARMEPARFRAHAAGSQSRPRPAIFANSTSNLLGTLPTAH